MHGCIECSKNLLVLKVTAFKKTEEKLLNSPLHLRCVCFTSFTQDGAAFFHSFFKDSEPTSEHLLMAHTLSIFWCL